jgi:hypothetical protein
VFAFTLSVAGVGVEATPEPASLADQVIPTFALFQPAALGTGARTAVTAGPVLSSVYEPWAVLDEPVHFPCTLTFGEAAAVTPWAPFPVPAVVVNVQLILAVGDVRVAVIAPVTSTHWVSLLVMTVRVSAPPCFA